MKPVDEALLVGSRGSRCPRGGETFIRRGGARGVEVEGPRSSSGVEHERVDQGCYEGEVFAFMARCAGRVTGGVWITRQVTWVQ